MTPVLLLSGGASRRMGQDKASLPWQGTTLLGWQEQRLSVTGREVISRLPDSVSGYAGPLAGILAALEAQPELRALLVMPVDMPALSTQALQRLEQAGQLLGRPVWFANSPLPAYLPVTHELKKALQERLSSSVDRKSASIKSLLAELSGEALQDIEPQELTNINTPDEWQQWCQGASQR